ncbi:MAG: hypothetical protein CSA95_07405 [Bacteroidetes bacterium]|nr:MAG: hypothetical protein CSA95_07405 [Bacteroidota bacterium]PIE88659.1 MAG: hypothetical protein CSA04_00715 [Bacteroidota bacterium]
METIQILGIFIGNRKNEAQQVQKLLTSYGCSIRTRIGLHDISPEACCGSGGLLLIELVGSQQERENLIQALHAIAHIQVKEMLFSVCP